jgi:hypothetical protein
MTWPQTRCHSSPAARQEFKVLFDLHEVGCARASCFLIGIRTKPSPGKNHFSISNFLNNYSFFNTIL